jgi:hypothetical protein
MILLKALDWLWAAVIWLIEPLIGVLSLYAALACTAIGLAVALGIALRWVMRRARPAPALSPADRPDTSG